MASKIAQSDLREHDVNDSNMAGGDIEGGGVEEAAAPFLRRRFGVAWSVVQVRQRHLADKTNRRAG
jgi:hypothetical protein